VAGIQLGGKFFWFNTGYFVIMIASVVTYDLCGGNWVILPLAWAIERFFVTVSGIYGGQSNSVNTRRVS
jgi:hypothetical protein